MDSQEAAEMGWTDLRFASPRFPGGHILMKHNVQIRTSTGERVRGPVMDVRCGFVRSGDRRVPSPQVSLCPLCSHATPVHDPRSVLRFCDFALLRTLHQPNPTVRDLLRLALKK